MTNQSALLQKHAQIGDVSDGKGAIPFFKAYVYLSAAVAAVIGVMMLRASGVRLLATQAPDASLGVPISVVLIGGGILHVAYSAYVFAIPRLIFQAGLLLSLGLIGLVYRVGLILNHVESPPPIMQAVGMKFEMQPSGLDFRWKWLIAWLVIGSVIVWVCEWRRLRRLEAAAFINEWRKKRPHE